MPMDNVTLENTQQSISSRDSKSVASVMVNGKWVNLSDTLEQANVKSDVGAVSKQVAEQQTVITSTVAQADSAVAYANDAIEKSKVNSQAIVAQGEAISEAKSAIYSATAEIQQAVANAASDAANIRADVAQVQNEVDTAKAANSASVEALKSDVSATKQDLADVHDSLTKAQAAAEESQKAIDKSIAQINSDIEQDRKDIASAQQANADTAKQLDAYSKQAQDQGKTIKSIQDKQDGFTATLADVQGNVTQVSDKVGGLSASLKDAQDNVASVKAQADQLSATLTDHTKSISTLTASAKELSSTLEDADGRLSKVEQTAQTNSSTLSDVQGDLSQVKQDATTLTSTLKDAQGNISTLQQKADSVSDQLTSAQGDIASLQTDVKGIKATLVSHDGDIHTLQADSKTLKDNMQDVQGNISTLQKTSTDVTSELQDHAGRISKVEQTASTLTNEFSDQDGRLSKVEQTATGTQQTVANQQGQINSIQTDVSGIHETITGQGNQITTINATLNGLDTKYEGVSGDLGKLKDQNDWKTVTGAFDANQYTNTARIFYQDTNAKNTPNAGWFYLIVDAPSTSRITQKLIRDNTTDTWTRVYNGSWQAWTKGATQTDVTALSGQITTNSTQITQNKQAIALKADQTEVDQVKQTATQNSSRLDVMDGKISSKVTSTDVNNIVDSKGFATTNTVQSLITQKAGTISESIVKLNQTVKQGAENNVQLVRKSDFEDSDKGGWDAQTVVTTDPPAELGQSGMKVLQTNVRDDYEEGIWYSVKPGEKFDVDFWCKPSTACYSQLGLAFVDKDYNNFSWGGIATDQSGQWKHYTGTITAGANASFAKPWFQMEKDRSNTTDTALLAKPSIRRQNATTVAAIQQITASIDGIKSTVATKADQSAVTQLSNLVQTKVSSGDFASTTTQLKNEINQRVQVGDVISQINQEAGGDTLIQVSNGKGSLILDAGNTIITGKAWIPSAAIANLTADQVQAGTLSGSKVHAGDNSGNAIDMGALSTDYVGFHAYANNGDNTYIDLNGIHNYGTSYDTRIKQGKITTDLLAVNGGGLIDFRAGGAGATLSNQEFRFYNSNSVNGGLSFSGSVPIAPAADGIGGNELRIRYDRSFAVTPISDDSARICASPAVLELGFVQSGSSTPERNNTGLWVDRNNRYINLGVWETDSTWSRIAAGSHSIQMQANDAHTWLGGDGTFHIYRDNDGGSATATKLQVDGWAWVRGWVEAAGHSQHSALSTKTDIQSVDDDKMLKMVNDTDLTTFLYKTDVANGETHRHIGPIIDDVHDVAQYQTPQDFIAPNGVSRDDDNMIGALFGAVKALTKRIKTLESKAN